MRHQLTHEDRVKGGKKRAAMPDFPEHQREAFQVLQVKRPDAAMWVYRQKILPYMRKKEVGQ